MRAIVREDMIAHVSENGDTEIGELIPSIGYDRARFDGDRVVDLMDYAEMWVRSLSPTSFELHVIEVENSQLVPMTYEQRKYLTIVDDVIRLKTDQEIIDEAEAEQTRMDAAQQFRDMYGNVWIQRILTATPDQVEIYIDNNVTDLASAKEVLTKLAIIVGYLARKVLS